MVYTEAQFIIEHNLELIKGFQNLAWSLIIDSFNAKIKVV